MIAACPRCSTRFRVGAERLRDEGVRLRCTQCQSVFRVYPPHAAAPRRRDDPAVEAELTPPPRPPERERMVLVADADAARGKASADALGNLGLHVLLVHDGVEALLALQRNLPARALLDAGLDRLSGAELCEVVKRNESLRGTHVVMAGTASSWASLAPLRAAGLGPDALVEHADLPDALVDALRLSRPAPAPVSDAASDAADPPSPAPPATPSAGSPFSAHAGEFAAAPSPVVSDPTPDGVDPEDLARAERLARIIVSDIVLYNAERFERGLRDGNVASALAAELEEGRALFRQRVRDEIREARDFLGDELDRTVQSRTGRPPA